MPGVSPPLFSLPPRGKAFGRPSVPPLRNSLALLQGPVPDRPAGGQRLPLRKCDGELSHLSVGADDPGGPRAHAVRPYGVCSAGSVFLYSSHQPARGSGDHKGRPYGDIWIFQPGPRAADSRPYIGKRPRTLVRKRQAQKRNRSNCNFPHSQAPVGRKGPLTATQILRAGNFLPNLRDNPRNGGSRGPTPPVRGRCRVKRDRGGRDGAHGG